VKNILKLILSQSVNIFPEPTDQLIVWPAVGVHSIIFEILKIDIFLSIDDHVELMRLENRQKVMRNNFVYSIAKVLDHFDDTGGTVMLDPTITSVLQKL